MPNPYKSSKMSRRKRKHKFRYGLAVIYLFPAYIFWQLGRLVPESLGRKTRRFFDIVTRPFANIIQFIQMWFQTRPWRKLWVAAPVIILIIFLISTIYIAENQSDEDTYKDYLRGAYGAMGSKDYKQASFLFGKLLSQPQYSDDPQLLYQSMVAANENDNQLRVNHLLTRLTGEMDYPPAHMWVATRYLKRSSGAASLELAIQHVAAALQSSDEADKDRMRQQLASLYIRGRQYSMGSSIINEIEKPSPSIMVMLMNSYYKSDRISEAKRVAGELLSRLETEDPEGEMFLMEHVDTLNLLATSTGTLTQKSEWLQEAIHLLEERIAIAPDDQKFQEKLAAVYLGISWLWLKSGDEAIQRKAFRYFDQCIATGHPPQTSGSILLSVSNLTSSGGLTEKQIMARLVDGDGVVICHLLLGIDAWNDTDLRTTMLHFRLAYVQNEQALNVLELMAIALSGEGTGGSTGFSLGGEDPWRKGIKLLKVLPEIDQSMQASSLLGQCVILSNRHRWYDIPSLLEPRLSDLPKDEKVQCYRWLILAHQNLGHNKQAVKYQQLWDELSAVQ